MPAEHSIATITAEVRRRARSLHFVETDGGPLLLVSGEGLLQWYGVFDANGEIAYEIRPCDYDRACSYRKPSPFLLEVGATRALVLPGTGPTAWISQGDGGLLVRWYGADSAAALLQVALSIPERAWKCTRLRLQVGATRCLYLIDSAADGRSAKRDRKSRIALAEGGYQLYRTKSPLEGHVLDGGRRSEYCTEVFRLSRALDGG